MREIHVDTIISAVVNLFIDANINLSQNVIDAIRGAIAKEEAATGKEVLRELIRNAEIAKEEGLPVCQDTGLAITFIEIGQDVHITGGNLSDAISEGVKGLIRRDI
jgi:fumarate hydratase subunit alpha